MQQRYYDPLIPRFLSVDPVTVNSVTGANFCRYCYGANNPYKFTDPDGRQQKITPQFFQNQGYPKSMLEAQRRQTQAVAFAQAQSAHAVAARLDNVEAGATAVSLALIETPAAPAAIATQGIAEAAGLVALAIEPNKERAINLAAGGLLKGLQKLSSEGTLAAQAVGAAEIGKDTSTVVSAVNNSVTQTPAPSNTQQSNSPESPVKADPTKEEE